jgi:hypothetical protein
MKTQTITWTALPNGVVAGKNVFKLSVFVAPRLQTDSTSPTLSLFPDFTDWPATLFPSTSAVSFSVQFGTQPAVTATRTGTLPRSDLWKALFPSTSRVESFAFASLQNRAIQSYPQRNVYSFLQQQYTELAASSGQDFPLADPLVVDSGAPFRPLAFTLRGNSNEKLVSSFQAELQKNKSVNAGNIANPDELAKSFLQAKLFHKPFSPTRVKITRPVLDFHRLISSLGDYPVLLRVLGLVHDLEVPMPRLGDTTVQVIAKWTPRDASVTTVNLPNANQRFETRCHAAADAFNALPRALNPEITDSMLPFEDTKIYDVMRIDVDGAALKTLDFAGNIGMARTLRKTDDTPETTSVPALRSAGFSVVRVNRAAQTHSALVRQTTLNSGLTGNTTLDAEDITRGFAIDVWDSMTTKWHSLCQRVGTYEFTRPSPPLTLDKAEDEGWVAASLTSAADGSSDIFRQGEALFHWTGWSLSAPRPGKTMDADGNPAPPGTEIDPDFKLAAHFQAKPGSLPRLRYGVSYRLRARAVDLAGNRQVIDDKSLASNAHATRSLVYGRFEPVPPPVVVMRRGRTEGESVERLVIRSNYDAPVETNTERHIVPPKSAETLAEDHGLFDSSATGKVDASTYSLIVARENGVITGKPDPDNYNRPYVDADTLELPYLPDSLSRGASFRLPGTAAYYLTDFGYTAGAKWPNALPFRLVLGEAPSLTVKFDETNRVLQVLIAKGAMFQVRLSSYMDRDGTSLMGITQWLLEAGKDAVPATTLATHGMHWMLTPYKTLTLVHAVRQPLLTPEWSDQMGRTRGVGQTYATIYDRNMRLSRKSTVKLDIVATWDETLDPLGEAGPRVIHGQARPYDFPVPYATTLEEEEVLYVHGRHEFGDTKYRAVTYSAIATTRFSEYFLQRRKDVQLKGTDTFLLDAKGVVAGSEAVRLVTKTASYKRFDAANKTGDYVVDYTAGTIRRTKSTENTSAIPENTNLEITYLVPPVTRVMVKPQALDILSSARPQAPKVLYIVPTFTWEAGAPSTDKKVVSSKRTGGGIRIYLERPWFTSGDGELLGAVIWPNPAGVSLVAQPPPEKVKPYITQWGLDPVFRSQATDPCPTLAAFPLSKPAYQATGLVLEEVPDEKAKVNIAGHTVAYDSERRLWYCDMDINAGPSYFPFVRLALVRYQPHSLSEAITGPGSSVLPTSANVHLSRVVLADFIQLAPDRSASIVRNDSNPLLRHVSVTGRSYQMFNGQTGPSVMEISLEQRRSGIKPEIAQELVWEPVSPVIGSNTVTLVHNSNVTDKTGNTTWTGDITLPDGTNTFRLLIKEFEFYNEPGIVPIVRRRLVYADAIELTP